MQYMGKRRRWRINSLALRSFIESNERRILALTLWPVGSVLAGRGSIAYEFTIAAILRNLLHIAIKVPDGAVKAL
jgi:hypothetical protein